MSKAGFILLCLFYVTSIASGFLPYIYLNDIHWYINNQSHWLLAAIIFLVLSKTTAQRIISGALVFLTLYDLIDEILKLNTYNPKTVGTILTLDLIIVVSASFITLIMLVWQWRKGTR